MRPRPQKRVDQLKQLRRKHGADFIVFKLMDTEKELRDLKQTFDEFEGAVIRASRLAMRYKELLEQAEIELKTIEVRKAMNNKKSTDPKSAMQTEAPGRPLIVSQPGREGNQEPKSVEEDDTRLL